MIRNPKEDKTCCNCGKEAKHHKVGDAWFCSECYNGVPYVPKQEPHGEKCDRMPENMKYHEINGMYALQGYFIDEIQWRTKTYQTYCGWCGRELG